ncbi:MAG TPA: BrxA family protein [Ardenticatenaceae bacterium]|nr:BrxA family protein [Ardenticatenaceae bacterium]
MTGAYTSRLSVGLGLIDETRTLLELWHEAMDGHVLYQRALESGRFPNVSARRLRNVVVEGFGLRYLDHDRPPARILKGLQGSLSAREFEQLLFIYTCRVHTILADFVREVYWSAYSAGREGLSNAEARTFVDRAIQEGKTVARWSDGTIQNVAGFLTGSCADFGLLEKGQKTVRRILPFRIEPRVAAILTYDLHFAGLPDNRVIGHPDWALFGMEPADVVEELKRLALRGFFIVQHAAGVTRIGWQYKTAEELIDGIARG